jgi:Bacterial pre-peptidase C-terminal domain
MLPQSNSQTSILSPLSPLSPLSTPSILDNRPLPLSTPPTVVTSSSVAFSTPLEPVNNFGGSTINNATNLGVISGIESIRDVVGVNSSKPNSYYRFSINSLSNVNLTLTNLTGDADLRLLDASGNLVRQGSLLFGYTQDESISFANLEAGEYYVRINQFSGDTTFNLNLSADRAGGFPDNASNLLANEFELNNVWGTVTQTGTISNNNTSDTYHFDNPFVSGNYSINLTGLTSDVDVRVVRDANRNGIVDTGDVISNSIRLGTDNETIELQGLGTGDYFVQIYQGSPSSNTNYTFTINNQPGVGLSTEPDDSIDQAYNVKTLNGSRHFNGSLSARSNGDGSVSGDSQDFYRFSLGTTSDFSLSLTGMNSNANVEVIRDANNNGRIDVGEVIALSTSSGINPEAILMQGLGAGNYIVRVYQDANTSLTDTNYSLTLNASPGLGLPGLPGSTSEIKTLNGVREFGGAISNRRPTDLYFFDLTTRSDFKLDLTGLRGDLDVRVYADTNRNGVIDAGEAVIGSSLRLNALSESINLQGLQSGRYIVKISQGTGILDFSNYVLKLEANPSVSNFGSDDNSRSRAVNFGSLTNSSRRYSVNDFVGTSDTQDFYRFTVGERGTLSVDLARLSADADLELQSSDGTVLSRSENRGTQSEFITQNLVAGEYFIRVYQGLSSSNTNYNLDIDFQPAFR